MAAAIVMAADVANARRKAGRPAAAIPAARRIRTSSSASRSNRPPPKKRRCLRAPPHRRSQQQQRRPRLPLRSVRRSPKPQVATRLPKSLWQAQSPPPPRPLPSNRKSLKVSCSMPQANRRARVAAVAAVDVAVVAATKLRVGVEENLITHTTDHDELVIDFDDEDSAAPTQEPAPAAARVAAPASTPSSEPRKTESRSIEFTAEARDSSVDVERTPRVPDTADYCHRAQQTGSRALRDDRRSTSRQRPSRQRP